MIETLETAAARDGGIILNATLADLGVHPSAVRRLVASGRLVRIRTGAYVTAEAWRAANADARYRLLVRASACCARHPLVLSHHSAAVLHGLPMIGNWPTLVHTSRPDITGGRRSPHVVAHRAGPPPATTTVDGLTVTALERTLVDIAIAEPWTVSVPMLDHALRVEKERIEALRRRGRNAAPELSVERLSAEVELVGPTRGRRRAEGAIAFADARSGSPGESFSRVRMHELGFEAPELQARFNGVGRSYAEVDFLWRVIRLIGEFDGAMKYTRSVELSRMDAASVVYEEKRREDALRRRGLMVVRWDWPLVRDVRAFARLLHEHGVPRR